MGEGEEHNSSSEVGDRSGEIQVGHRQFDERMGGVMEGSAVSWAR